jgi:hypothetical protein
METIQVRFSSSHRQEAAAACVERVPLQGREPVQILAKVRSHGEQPGAKALPVRVVTGGFTRHARARTLGESLLDCTRWTRVGLSMLWGGRQREDKRRPDEARSERSGREHAGQHHGDPFSKPGAELDRRQTSGKNLQFRADLCARDDMKGQFRPTIFVMTKLASW